MARHRPLLVAWLVTLVAFLVGIFGQVTVLAVLPQFIAMALAILTIRRAEATGQLRYTWLYRGALVVLLAAAGACLIAGGSTVAVASELRGTRVIGFIALATTNLVVAILAWRALVRPAPRRAAFAGLVAVVAELFAMVVDVLLNIIHTAGASKMELGTPGIVAIYASFAATWAGVLVCIAALASFDRSDSTDVPQARVVDEP